MGTTYSNCQVRCDSQEAVVAALTGLLKEPAYVSSPVGGWVGVYPEGALATDVLAAELSRRLSASVFDWSVYDSDVFFYSLYENGERRDEFNSDPHYFESMRAEGDEDETETIDPTRVQGNPQALLPYCVADTTLAAIQEVLHPMELLESSVDTAILPPGLSDTKFQIMAEMLGTTAGALAQGIARKTRDKYLFADHQATDLANLLGMDADLAQLRYSDIAEGDLEDYGPEDFRLIGNENLSQEYIDGKLWQTECLQNHENLSHWLKQGANPNTRNQSGLPPLLHFVLFPKHIEILLAAGADVNIISNPSPYYGPQYPEMKGHYEAGVTALMVAARASVEHPTRQLETIQVLLDAGANVNARSETGRTPLGEALKMTDPAQHQGKIGRRAPEEVLQQAAARSEQVVEILRAAGATE